MLTSPLIWIRCLLYLSKYLAARQRTGRHVCVIFYRSAKKAGWDIIMILGIGIDIARIDDIKRYIEDEELSKAYITHTFTEGERKEAESRYDKAEYFATRFAAKEAVFKALAQNTREKTYDLRITETLDHADGSPYVNITDELKDIMDKAGAASLFISITTEDNYAAAFVIAEK